MKIRNENFLDFLLLLIGVIMFIILKNSTRFIGVGLISLATTYLLIDNIGIYAKRKTIYHRKK